MKEGKFKFLIYDTSGDGKFCTGCYFFNVDDPYVHPCPADDIERFNCKGIFKIHKDFTNNVLPNLS